MWNISFLLLPLINVWIKEKNHASKIRELKTNKAMQKIASRDQFDLVWQSKLSQTWGGGESSTLKRHTHTHTWSSLLTMNVLKGKLRYHCIYSVENRNTGRRERKNTSGILNTNSKGWGKQQTENKRRKGDQSRKLLLWKNKYFNSGRKLVIVISRR